MRLVINTFVAALHRQGDRFLIQAAGRKIGLSAHKVQSILIATRQDPQHQAAGRGPPPGARPGEPFARRDRPARVVETRRLWDEAMATTETEPEDSDDLDPILPDEDVTDARPQEEPPC
jgi:hypothetical protein